MRLLPLILLTILAAPAAAQAAVPYDNYPVCLQVYFPSNTIECSYTSIAQCKVSASGRSAQCMVNPYFVGSTLEPRGPRRRHRTD